MASEGAFGGPSVADDPAELRQHQLRTERGDLSERFDKQGAVRSWLSGAILLYIPAAGQCAFWYRGAGYYALVAGFLVLVAAWQVTRFRLRELESDRRQIDYELAVLSSPAASKPETLFLKHQFDLQRYYDQTLRHGDLIFYVGVLGLLASLAIIGGAFVLIESSKNTTTSVVVAALAAVGSLFSNSFVFLYRQMHTSALSAVTDFHKRLVEDHQLQFANLLVSQTVPANAVDVRHKMGLKVVENHRRGSFGGSSGRRSDEEQ